MGQVNKPRTFADLSKEELMDFVMTLNKCMKDYDNDIEYRMKCSEKGECDSIKRNPNKLSKNSLRILQHTRK